MRFSTLRCSASKKKIEEIKQLLKFSTKLTTQGVPETYQDSQFYEKEYVADFIEEIWWNSDWGEIIRDISSKVLKQLWWQRWENSWKRPNILPWFQGKYKKNRYFWWYSLADFVIFYVTHTWKFLFRFSQFYLRNYFKH